jgi:hypothetical protein
VSEGVTKYFLAMATSTGTHGEQDVERCLLGAGRGILGRRDVILGRCTSGGGNTAMGSSREPKGLRHRQVARMSTIVLVFSSTAPFSDSSILIELLFTGQSTSSSPILSSSQRSSSSLLPPSSTRWHESPSHRCGLAEHVRALRDDMRELLEQVQ